MAIAIPSLLQPAAVNDRVSRLKVNNTTLQRKWGMQKGGPADRVSPYGRRGSYDVFNDTRGTTAMTLPGTPAARVAPNPTGNVPFQIPRFHEAVPLLAEVLHNLRPIGGPVGQIDSGGEQYIADQERIEKQKLTNVREFMVAGMMRGGLSWTIPNLFSPPVLSYDAGAAAVTGSGVMNYQIPSGNFTQGNMIGGGNIVGTTWDNAAAPIVTNILAINAAFIELTGRGLRGMVCTSVMWGYILANTQVQNLAGSVNQPFEYINQDSDTEEFTARLRAVPWLPITITDNGLNTGSGASSLISGVEIGPFEKFIQDTAVAFMIEQDPIVAQFWNCGEPVSRWQGAPAVIISGEDYWVAPTWDPTGFLLMTLLNGLPVLQVPAGVAYLTTKF